ncbi:MAG: sigma-70 factor domain-containing protein, partial [Planctomycetaceae bacterium]
MYGFDEKLAELVATAETNNGLDFVEMCDYLPNKAESCDKLDLLLEALQDRGLRVRANRSACGDIVAALAPRPQRSERSGESSQGVTADSIRMYLRQMGRLPMLDRGQEISVSKRIDVTRKQFRRQVLGAMFIYDQAVDLLARVYSGDLPFDRTIEVCVTEGREKQKVQGRLGPNLATIATLRQQIAEDFDVLTRRRASQKARDAAATSIEVRRGRLVALLEELGLREQKLKPFLEKLEQIFERMKELERQRKRLSSRDGSADRLSEVEAELRQLIELTLETPQSLAERMKRIAVGHEEYEQAKQDLANGNLRLVVS